MPPVTMKDLPSKAWPLPQRLPVQKVGREPSPPPIPKARPLGTKNPTPPDHPPPGRASSSGGSIASESQSVALAKAQAFKDAPWHAPAAKKQRL